MFDRQKRAEVRFYVKTGVPQQAVAEFYNVSASTINNIIHNSVDIPSEDIQFLGAGFVKVEVWNMLRQQVSHTRN